MKLCIFMRCKHFWQDINSSVVKGYAAKEIPAGDFDFIWFIYLRCKIHISNLHHWSLKWKRFRVGAEASDKYLVVNCENGVRDDAPLDKGLGKLRQFLYHDHNHKIRQPNQESPCTDLSSRWELSSLRKLPSSSFLSNGVRNDTMLQLRSSFP
jgi:hypothetical protein